MGVETSVDGIRKEKVQNGMDEGEVEQANPMKNPAIVSASSKTPPTR
jgi:hypothetical protein